LPFSPAVSCRWHENKKQPKTGGGLTENNPQP